MAKYSPLTQRDFDRLCDNLDFDKPIDGNISVGNIRGYLSKLIEKTNNDYQLMLKVIEVKFAVEYGDGETDRSKRELESSGIHFACAAREIGRKDLMIHFLKMSGEWDNPTDMRILKLKRELTLNEILK